MTGYVIVDLDGCLSDDRPRRHLLPEHGGSYDRYHAACASDRPVEKVLSDVKYDALDEHGAQQSLLLIVTGRNEDWRFETDDWLNRHLPGLEYHILMRSQGRDFRWAPQLKMELLDNYFFNEHAHSGGINEGWARVVSAYDDRQDILDRYPIRSDAKHLTLLSTGQSVPEILRTMAETYEQRNAVYGDNFKNVAPLMKALFPDGVPERLVTTSTWHLFELVVVKLTRFANSNLKHTDSVHDIAVYSAMIESELTKE